MNGKKEQVPLNKGDNTINQGENNEALFEDKGSGIRATYNAACRADSKEDSNKTITFYGNNVGGIGKTGRIDKVRYF